MEKVFSILCVSHTDTCRGPLMKFAVERYFAKSGMSVNVQSAAMIQVTINEKYIEGGASELINDQPAVDPVIEMLSELGFGAFQHLSCSIGKLPEGCNLNAFDLIICADSKKAQAMQKKYGVSRDRIAVLNPHDDEALDGIGCPHPSLDRDDYDTCLMLISYHVVNILADRFQRQLA